MKLDCENWGYEQTDLNELRFAAIWSIIEYCHHPGHLCVNCSRNSKCQIMFIHDAVKKIGLHTGVLVPRNEDELLKLRNWASEYIHENPRA